MSSTPAKLEQILGAKRALATEDALLPYAEDESGLGAFMPDAVAKVVSAEEIREVLRLALCDRIPITPRGLGSGQTGGALAVNGGIVLSTELMTAIEEIDEDNLTAVVEPGLITGELQAAVEAHNLFYPPDPASLDYCSIGGNVAENAGGPRAFKYGVTREYVLGLDIALIGGEVHTIGRRTMKGVTGLDLVGTIVGSEGILAVVSKVILKLLPKPPAVVTFLARFTDVLTAGEAVAAMIRQGYRPRTLELLDEQVVEHLRAREKWTLPNRRCALLLVELDGAADNLERELTETANACERAGAEEILVATDELKRRQIWEMRREASPSLREQHRFKHSEDIVVPRGNIPEMLRRLDQLSVAEQVTIASFGHAGDGNLHVNVLYDDPEKDQRRDAILKKIFEHTLALGGTLSGEHGIGIAKRGFMHLEQSEELIALQRKMKAVFDPHQLLNPGKLLP